MQICKNINTLIPKKLASFEKASPLQQQLLAARRQIALLREENTRLKNIIQSFDSAPTPQNQPTADLSIVESLREEIQFRKRKQKTMEAMLNNCQTVNSALRSRLNELQSKTPALSSTSKTNESFETHHQCMSSSASNRKNTQKNDQHHKQNHPITPKSRVSLDKKWFSQVNEADPIKNSKKVWF